ncbi:hypothetical protein EDB89DRAFT_1901956 [Lactarius sanguifluus]|nr:hypothetical protein EDB89DRAFT_1901956 [Lactarius sanguifluus]
MNGEGWAWGSHALACPLFACMARHGQGEEEGLGGWGEGAVGPVRTPSTQMGKGGAGGGGPSHTPLITRMGRHALVHPFCANGEWWCHGWHTLACTLSTHTGGMARGKGRPKVTGRGGASPRAPFRANGEGRGWDSVPLCPPFRANSVGRPRGMGWDQGRCALVHTPSA